MHKVILLAMVSGLVACAPAFAHTASAPFCPNGAKPLTAACAVTSKTQTSVALDWSQDYAHTYSGYYVRLNGGARVKYPGSTGTVSGLSPGSTYTICISVDLTASNHPDESPQACISVTTLPPDPTPTPTATPTPTPTPPPSPSCTIYASSTGDSASTGSTEATATTLSHAASTTVPGSIVCLRAGTYDRSTKLFIDRSGASGSPVTYTSYEGEAIIRYTGATTSGGLVQVNGAAGWAGVHHIVLKDLTLNGGNAVGWCAGATAGAHHVTFQRLRCSAAGATGIACNGVDYCTAVGNLIYHSGYNQGWSSGISLWYGGRTCTWGGTTPGVDTAPGFHNFIVGNVISGQFDGSTNHSDGNGIIVDGCGAIPPYLIANNVVYQNGGRGIESLANTGSGWVVNNTLYTNALDLSIGSGAAPEQMGNSATDLHWVNDIADGRRGAVYSTGYTHNNTSSTIQWAKEFAFNGTTSGVSTTVLNDPSQYRLVDPLFNSPPSIPAGATPWASAVPPWSLGGALTLSGGSPAVDAGTDPLSLMPSGLATSAATYLQTDAAGQPRVQGTAIDVGAYERAPGI